MFIHMLAYIRVMPLARCVGHANNKDVQNIAK